MSVGKLEIVPLRQAFAHEAHNFTIWLAQNIDALADRLHLRLTVLEREKSVGSFSVDLFCEDETGNYVIIENQLEQTDHDHLGKLLTYLVNLEAHTAIWITSTVRPEHQRVIDWLNETTGADYAFYLVRVEAIRIAGSPFAPLFTVLAAPDEQTREIGETKKELADRHLYRKEFWTQLLGRSKDKTRLFSTISPSYDHWISMGAGKSGFSFNYNINKNTASVELYIGSDEQAKNKAAFDELLLHKEQIEAEMNTTLEWRRLDEKQACRIIKQIDSYGGLKSPEKWAELQDEMIDMMIRLYKVLQPRISKLNI